MKCPRTGSNLKAVKVGGITVDISESCGGVFFDNYELEHFDEEIEERGSELANHLKQFTPPAIDLQERISCPKCTDMVMARHYYSPKNEVEIDECRGCGGIWFDFGELEKIRLLFPKAEDREKGSRDFENNFINSSEYKDYISQLEGREEAGEKRLNRAKKLTSFLYHFIS